MLSAWPSCSAAICSRSCLVDGNSRSLPPKARPVARPATTAADDDPNPFRGGTALWHSNRSGGTSMPISSSAFAAILAMTFSCERGRPLSPSP
eukprot:2196904-Prymnesium_polylepis.2